MAYLWSNGMVQMHIPKTGGKWVRKTMEATGHKIVRDVAGGHEPAPVLLNTPAFVFVRHPATWLASWWAHCQRHGFQKLKALPANYEEDNVFGKMQSFTSLHMAKDFPSFVIAVLADKHNYVTDFFDAFTSVADHVGKQESLKDDLERFVGPVADFDPFNVADNLPNISPAIRSIVAHHEDLTRYDYKP